MSATTNNSKPWEALLPSDEALLPTEFYNVRQETTPKGRSDTMRFFAVVAYIVAVIVFISLCVTQSQQYTIETVIKSADLSGSDGYTCQMISKVTAAYTISSSEPVVGYELVNVMESASQFSSDIASANPCYATQYIPPASPSVFLYAGSAKGQGVFNGIIYTLTAGSEMAGYFSILNTTNGQLVSTVNSNVYPYNSMAIGPNGEIVVSCTSGSFCKYDPITDSTELVTPTLSGVLLSDNSHNM